MADSTTSTLSNNIDDVLNKAVDFHYAPNLAFAREAVENGKQHENGRNAEQGDPVKFTLYNTLVPTTDTLSETPNNETPETVSNNQISVPLLQKGNFVTSTRKLETLSSLGDTAQTLGRLIGQNAAASTDQLALESAEAETGDDYNIYVGGTAKSSIDETDVLTSSVVRQAYARLEDANVPKIETQGGSYYLWFAPAHSIYDLKNESSGNTFREASLYAAPEQLMTGEVGAYEGFRFIATNAVKQDYGAGTETASTTVASSASAGATSIELTSATGFTTDAGVLEVTVSGVTYALDITGISGTTVTVNKTIRRNGFFYPSRDGDGIAVALSGGEAIVEKHTVYSNYAMGREAFAYAYAVRPEVIRTMADDPYNRLERIAWYALHNVKAYRPESLIKVYTGSSLDRNA